MRIAIVGAGGLGSVLGWLLHRSGHEVWLVRRSPDFVAAVNRSGLVVDGPHGCTRTAIRATCEPAEVGECDLVVLATKAYHVAGALATVRPALTTGTAVMTTQNGIGAADELSALLGPDQVIVGVAEGFGAAVRGTGRVSYEGARLLRLANAAGPVTGRLRHIADLWSDTGVPVAVFDDVAPMVWEKLVCNAAFSGVTALTRQTIGEVMASPDARRVALGCAREAYDVGRADGVRFSFDDVERYVTEFGDHMPHAQTSMLQDRLAGRPSEVDAIHGAVVASGARLCVPTPWNLDVTKRVHEYEAELIGGDR